MSEELYNSSDYCSLAEEYEELKKENSELIADKLYLIQAAMDGGDKYHYAAHDVGYRDMERKLKALEADFVISNRELLIKQVEINRLTAENAALREQVRWIPVSERLPENNQRVIFFADRISLGLHSSKARQWSTDGYNYPGDWYDTITHWIPLPPPPEGE